MMSENRSLMAFNLIWVWENERLFARLMDEIARLDLSPPHVGRSFPFEEAHAALQLTQLILARDALDLRPVGLRHLVLRVADARLQAAVVSQQHQALAVEIEAAGRVNAGYIDEVAERGAAVRVAKLAQDAKRLIQ